MNVTEADLRFVSRIYDTVLDSDHWQGVLDEFLPRVGAAGGNMMVDNANMKEIDLQITSSSYAPEVVAEFGRRYALYDARAVNALIDRTPMEWVDDEEAYGCPVEEIESAKGLLELSGNYRRTGTRLNDTRAWLDVIVVAYEGGRGNIAPAEREKSRLFLPHIAKAVAVTRPFIALRSRYDAVLEVLDHLDTGVFILSSDRSVIVMNSVASDIVGARNGFRLGYDGRLSTTDSDSAAELDHLLASAAHMVSADRIAASRRFFVEKRSGDMPYVVEVSPLRDPLSGSGQRVDGCLLYVVDPERRENLRGDGLQMLYGLTDAEAGICDLILEGQDTRTISDTRSTSINTTRSHLKSLLQKTGSSRQADLFRLAASLNIPLRD